MSNGEPGYYYTDTHEWVRLDGDTALVGISDHAAGEISDIVFVELPKPGQVIKQGEPFGTIESVKAVFDLNAPLTGKVLAINPAVIETPDMINRAPQSDGWLIRITPVDPGEIKHLMDTSGYEEFLRQ